LENAKATLHKTIKEIKLNITANTSHNFHCLLEYRMQNAYIVVRVACVERVVNMASYLLVNISAIDVVCGARSYCHIFRTQPMYGKIFNF